MALGYDGKPAPRALLGMTTQPLLALAVLIDLLEERLFDLGNALPHPHDVVRR